MPSFISPEYKEFLREEELARKLSFYETACKLSERAVPISPTKGLEKSYEEAIEFAHIKATPRGAFSLSILVSFLALIIPISVLVIIGSLSVSSTFLVISVAVIIAFFLFNYPSHRAVIFRINASSEMVLSIIYMSISMQLSPNLENAVKFASKNLRGALAHDLRNLLWEVYTRKYSRIDDALDAFINKWKSDNKQFAEALYLIKNSGAETQEKRERLLDEAVTVVLEGTKEKMSFFSRELKQPVTILNALGILLPIIGLVFFPLVSLFLPELIKPVFLIAGYNIFLPLGIYFFMNSYLEKRPYSFHQPDLSNHPDYKKEKLVEKFYFIPLLISLPLIGIGLANIVGEKELFSTRLLMFSILITIGITAGVVSYSFLSVRRKLKIRKEIADIENEFGEALFQLSGLVSRGMPIEKALDRISADIRDLKISRFFEIISKNMQNFSLTFGQAVFDQKYGAINYYPSTMIETIMRVIVETSGKGMALTAKTMSIVAHYLKDLHEVDESMKNLMEEVTSTMNIQAILLAPLSAGIVVSMTTIVTELLVSLGTAFDQIYEKLGTSLGPAAGVGGGVLSSIVRLSDIIPSHGFQLVVGIYMIEIVSMIAVFLSAINNGEESILKRYSIAKLLSFSTVVYLLVLLSTFYLFTSIVPLPKLIIS